MRRRRPIHSHRLAAQGFHFARLQSLRHRHGLATAWGSGALRTYTQHPWMEELMMLIFPCLVYLDAVMEKRTISKGRAWLDVVGARTVCCP